MKIGRQGDLKLHEISVSMIPQQEAPKAVRVQPAIAFADYPWRFSLAHALDDDPATVCTFDQRREEANVVVLFKPYETAGDSKLRLRFRTGGGNGRSLRHFRLYVTRAALAISDVRQAALELLEIANRKDPADYWVRMALAESLRQVFPADYREAMRHATAAVALRPNEVGAHAAVLRSLQGDEIHSTSSLRKLALDTARRVDALDPTHPALPELVSRLLSDRDRLSREVVDVDTLSKYELAIQLHPRQGSIQGTLGWYLHRGGRYQEAAAFLKEAIEFGEGDIWTLNVAGRLYRDMQDWQQAEGCLQRALQIHPRAFESRAVLANTLDDQGKTHQATEVWRTAAALSPQQDRVRRQLGMRLFNLGLRDDALDELRKARELAPGNIWNSTNLAYVLQSGGQVDEATKVYREITARAPNNANLHYRFAKFLQENGIARRKPSKCIGRRLN